MAKPWIGAIILFAVLLLAWLAFRQGMQVKREDRDDMGGLPPGGGPDGGA
jgi:hypothetical protein